MQAAFSFRSLLLIAFFALSTSLCWANLGDTLSQCIDRYGRPISHGKGDSTNAGLEWYAFKKGGYEFEAYFVSGTVRIEIVWKTNGSLDSPSARPAFSKIEQEAFLGANSGNEKWSEPQPTYKGTFWKRTDGATAMYSSIDNEMSFGLGGKRH